MVYGPGQAHSPHPALPAGPANLGPAVNPSWLAATADRERTAGVLRAGFTEGRLSQDEFDERVTQAYAARTYADLWALTADLPAGPLPVPGYPQGYPPAAAALPDTAADTAAPNSWQSGAALLITALVIFTLAALITAIVTAHAQTGVYVHDQPAVVTPVQHANLAPFITPQVKA